MSYLSAGWNAMRDHRSRFHVFAMSEERTLTKFFPGLHIFSRTPVFSMQQSEKIRKRTRAHRGLAGN
jgi:hypothetical protein